MASVFTRPLPFTVVSAQEGTTAKAINANDDRVGKVWRTTDGAGFIICDLGAGAYDTVALISNISINIVRVRTGDSASGIGAYDATQTLNITNKPLGFSTKTIFTIGTRAERYVRIDFSSFLNVEVQRIIIGPSIAVVGIDYDAEFSIIDSSEIETTLGSDNVEAGLRKCRWKIAMSMVPEADWKNAWIGFLSAVGKSTPILFQPFTEKPADIQSDVIFGRIRTDAVGKIQGLLYRTVEMTIEGLAL